ncbi:MAG: hypothetical protein EOP04_27540, partial [Proteobacteria bacterium]
MSGSPKFDLGISVRYLMTFSEGRFLVRENVFVGILDQKFACIVDGNGSEFEVSKRIDAPNGVLLPGLINAHTHLPMSLFRGLADDSSLKEWLFETVFPLEAQFADEAFCETGAELSLLEMIATGTTTVAEMY